MHTRRLLASSGILAALAALGACGRTTSPPPAGAAPPTAEEARAYVEAAERELRGSSRTRLRARARRVRRKRAPLRQWVVQRRRGAGMSFCRRRRARRARPECRSMRAAVACAQILSSDYQPDPAYCAGGRGRVANRAATSRAPTSWSASSLALRAHDRHDFVLRKIEHSRAERIGSFAAQALAELVDRERRAGQRRNDGAAKRVQAQPPAVDRNLVTADIDRLARGRAHEGAGRQAR